MEHLLERFRILEELDSLVLCEDSRAQVVFVSPFTLKFFGWHWNRIMGQEIGRLFPGEPCFAESPRGRTEIGNASREVRWRSFACEHRRSNGARVWIAWKRKPFPSPSGEPDHFLWTGKDITALVQVQDALMAQETRYRLFFNSLNDASFVHQPGPDGTPGPFVEVNDAACRRYGYTRDELLRMTPADLAVERVASSIHTVLEEGEALIQAVHRTRDGKLMDVEINAKRFYWDGKPTILSIVRDMTERRRQERALIDSEERHRMIFDHSPIGIIHLDRQGTIVSCNEQFLKMLGTTRDKVIGFNTLASLENDRMRQAVIDAFQGRTGHYEGDYRSVTGSGGLCVRTLYRAMTSSTGQCLGVVGIFEDITESRRAEKRIRSLNRQLMAAQERERQRLARELHDGVAQELSALKISLDTLFDAFPDAEAALRKKTAELSQSLGRTLASVRELAYGLRPAALDHLGLARAVSVLCDEFAEKTGISTDFMVVGFDDGLAKSEADIAIFRLIQESLQNVMKHAGASRVVLRLVASHPSILLRVEDDGKGFDVDHRPGEAGEKGMGIRSMKERVAALGGTMSIKSQSGKGTKIFVTIPYPEVCHEPAEDGCHH